VEEQKLEISGPTIWQITPEELGGLKGEKGRHEKSVFTGGLIVGEILKKQKKSDHRSEKKSITGRNYESKKVNLKKKGNNRDRSQGT